MIVFAEPPMESLISVVKGEFRYGMCLDEFVRAPTTSPMALKDLLMLCASCNSKIRGLVVIEAFGRNA